MTDYLTRALAHIGADEGDVLAHGPGFDGTSYVVVLDLGIEGCPKYRVPLAELPEPEPEAAPEPEPPLEFYLCPDCLREFDSERGLAVHQSRFCPALDEEE